MEANRMGQFDVLYNGIPCFLMERCAYENNKPILIMVRNMDYLEDAVENGFKQAASSGDVIKLLDDNIYNKMVNLKHKLKGLYLIVGKNVYVLTCYPYEPCTCIENEETKILIHNAYDLSYLFLENIYDMSTFYNDMITAIEFSKTTGQTDVNLSGVKHFGKQMCCNF